MNQCVEILNRWGESFSAVAWPMLWQSSLLIAVIFAFELVFARRIRPSVRYALWLGVLVKLLLPPALALPTGATWWLWRPHPVVEPAPAIQNYTVSFGNSAPEALMPPASLPVVEPAPKLSGDAWVLLAAIAVGAGLFSWLAFRWLSVAAKVRRATTMPTGLDGILEEVRQLAGLRRRLRLTLIDDRHSPAVYGLFRPVILLPRPLADKLSGRQLRAVLLHEAIHLRRGDVWVNCAQTLLQIVYWWHPLLWVANARIRRVREEAVDDAVMFALRDGADAYAPTLLEVAKFAFRRPLASLGLIGILESRSALRQRVERLVDFQPSRKAGVTFLSLCGIFAFSAVALPMGQGPATAPVATSTNDLQTEVFQINPNTYFLNLQKKVNLPNVSGKPSVKESLLVMNVQQLPDVVGTLKQVLLAQGVNLDPPKSIVYNRDKETLSVHATAHDLAIIEKELQVLNDDPPIVYTSAMHGAIYRKMNQIHLDEVSYHDLPLSEVLRQLRKSSLKLDPDKQGINFLFNPNVEQINPNTGLPKKADATSETADWTRININLSLNNVSLKDLLNAICLVADHPIKYSVFDYGIVFSVKGTNSPPYEMRTFKVDPAIFSPNLEHKAANDVAPNDRRNINALAKAFFSNLVVNFDPPKTIFFNDKLGVLFVYATPQDLDVIEKAVLVLNDPPPLFHVQAYQLDGETFLPPEKLSGALTNYTGNVGMAEIQLEARKLQDVYRQAGCTNVRVVVPRQRITDGIVHLKAVIVGSKDGTMGKATQNSSDAPPMIHIKARFIEVPQKLFSSAAANSLPPGMTNGGILTTKEMINAWRLLESQKGSEELAEPEATTIEGRHLQMRATIIQPIVTGYTLGEASTAPVPKVEQVETGPILDVVPTVLSDGYTIHLRTIPSLISFLGYAGTKGLAPAYATNALGKRIKMPGVLPVFTTKEVSVDKTIYDGQTLVLPVPELPSLAEETDEKSRELIAQYLRKARKKEGDKALLVFVTATMIDPAGNRTQPIITGYSFQHVYDWPDPPKAVPGSPVQLP